MNLFITSTEPAEAAAHLDDKRLIKAVLETAQLLSTALAVGYKPTHAKHPVTKWVAARPEHLAWTHNYFRALSAEYTRRFNKVHKSSLLDTVFTAQPKLSSGPAWQLDCAITFQNSARNTAIGLDFTAQAVPESYRSYLCAKWCADKRPPKWTSPALSPAWCPDSY